MSDQMALLTRLESEMVDEYGAEFGLENVTLGTLAHVLASAGLKLEEDEEAIVDTVIDSWALEDKLEGRV